MTIDKFTAIVKGIAFNAGNKHGALRDAKGRFLPKELQNQSEVRMIWRGRERTKQINLTMKQRVKLATEMIKTKVVRNLATPVVKGGSPVRVLERSKPGEFPRADTSTLLRSIFTSFKSDGRTFDGFVGTPLDYGLFLEKKLDRSFLERTLVENRALVKRILTKRVVRLPR